MPRPRDMLTILLILGCVLSVSAWAAANPSAERLTDRHWVIWETDAPIQRLALREVGVTTGGLLLGRLDSTGKTFSEGVVKPLIHVFDRIAGTPLAKNDEAVAGLAEIIDDVGEANAVRIFERYRMCCPGRDCASIVTTSSDSLVRRAGCIC